MEEHDHPHCCDARQPASFPMPFLKAVALNEAALESSRANTFSVI